jgi:hypothetical protein
MNYLLVGNGPTQDLARASDAADSIVQINSCRHAANLPAEKTHHIFIANMGAKVSMPLCKAIEKQRALLRHATVVLGRNPYFYASKRAFLQVQDWKNALHDYHLTEAWRTLAHKWKVERVSFLSSMRLEWQLRQLGMRQATMPSTGMIAYDWLLQRLKPEDTITIEGFSFEGWPGHPWAIESQLIRSVGTLETRV